MAKKYGIEYTPHDCNNTEDCSGTCIMCEYEVRMLHNKIREKKGLPFVYTEEEDQQEEQEERNVRNSIFRNRKYSSPFQIQGYITED